jgi:hypothetical protein
MSGYSFGNILGFFSHNGVSRDDTGKSQHRNTETRCDIHGKAKPCSRMSLLHLIHSYINISRLHMLRNGFDNILNLRSIPIHSPHTRISRRILMIMRSLACRTSGIHLLQAPQIHRLLQKRQHIRIKRLPVRVVEMVCLRLFHHYYQQIQSKS